MRSLVVLALVVGGYGVAAAEEDPLKADKVFEEAQKLKAEGKAAEACQKYAEALQYNQNAVGTLLNVALCNEEAGKYATAVKHYTHARDLAREHNLVEHRQAAEEKLAIVTPLVARVAIAFAEQAPNMKLVIDETVIALDKTDDIVLDPGVHHIVVTAPGRVPWETNVTVEKSKAKAIAVPKLGHPVTNKGRRTVGIILSAAGVAMIGTGIGLGVHANSKWESQIGTNCSNESPPQCNAEGYRITNQALTFGNFGTYIGFAGVGVAALGAYLWFFGPKAKTERNVSVVPTLTPDAAGVTAVGRF